MKILCTRNLINTRLDTIFIEGKVYEATKYEKSNYFIIKDEVGVLRQLECDDKNRIKDTYLKEFIEIMKEG